MTTVRPCGSSLTAGLVRLPPQHSHLSPRPKVVAQATQAVRTVSADRLPPLSGSREVLGVPETLNLPFKPSARGHKETEPKPGERNRSTSGSGKSGCGAGRAMEDPWLNNPTKIKTHTISTTNTLTHTPTHQTDRPEVGKLLSVLGLFWGVCQGLWGPRLLLAVDFGDGKGMPPLLFRSQ